MITTNDYRNQNNDFIKMKYSIILFLFILVFNIWLYFYNYSLIWKLQEWNETVLKIEQSINEFNSDDRIKLYTLIKSNKEILKKFEYLSNIPLFINTLKILSIKYWVTFDWFSYWNSSIQTSVLAIDDWVSFWYQKTQKFLNNFRNQKTSNKEIFSLWFINSFAWQSQMKYSIKFDIK